MQAKRLRELLNQPGIIRAPGAYDAWSARLVEMAGFPVVYMTGYGASASALGQPDIGLMSMTEMATLAKNMAAAVTIPFIADGDTGYGGVLNVMRVVREYDQAGIAGIQLEDQVFPKRCGHMEGKQLISQGEMVAKIKAATHARCSPDFVIIARTDARAVTGFEDALRRAQAYVEAGADVIFFEAPQSVEEMKMVAGAVKKPCLANMVEKGKTPLLTAQELAEIGYKLVIYPVSLLFAATKAMQALLAQLKKDDTTANCLEKMVTFPEFNEMIGLAERRSLEKAFLAE
ncbi:MAG: isocitrate lyase/PEP mutase family protein [Heliobacteriaceae bacterium]|nr:isocitrate lyase/PEP mutase family protein [Heliobacteriaceae bacterium]MDD4587776.1 isocitrate lyase/PEP mutase family protein [Heliobacteriaceae bacterium]